MSSVCRVCQSPDVHPFTRRDAKNGQTMALMLCQGCSLVQVAQLPAAIELHHYYSQSYRQDYKQAHTPANKHIVRAAQAARERLRWIQPYLTQPAPELVDIGAGGGEFVYLSRRLGCRSRGLEPHEGYSDFARTAYDAEVETGGIENLGPGCADVITLFHVLEHLRDPWQVVHQLHQALRRGGLLAIEVPNILQADASPHNIYFGAHLYYYNALSLDQLLGGHFERLWFNDQGNLRVIYRRRDAPMASRAVPADALSAALQTFHARGWWTYLTQGRGWHKPWLRIQQRRLESRFKHHSPKAILDAAHALALETRPL